MPPFSISNLRPVAFSANFTPWPSGRNCSRSSRISTSTPRLRWTCCPLARRAIPIMPKKGASRSRQSRINLISRSLLTWSSRTCRGSMESSTTSGNLLSFSWTSLSRLLREAMLNIVDSPLSSSEKSLLLPRSSSPNSKNRRDSDCSRPDGAGNRIASDFIPTKASPLATRKAVSVIVNRIALQKCILILMNYVDLECCRSQE
mmetsp:Transcript_839/g.1783  ORF Transcript_839/g.1783 Transcript_839/m.1783 type:complete len:203 (+) Transcript_839:1108-1716(+)